MRAILVLCVLILLAQASDAGHRPIELRADPAVSVAWVQDVRLKTRVEPQAENVGVLLELDGDRYYSSHVIALDAQSPATQREVWFKAVPPGDYEARASLYRKFHDAAVAVVRQPVRIGVTEP